VNNGLGESTREKDELAKEVGYVASLMSQQPLYRTFPLACIQAWIMPALAHGQLKVFHDEKGSAIGYITWAYLAPDVAERWVHDPAVLLHLSEWNEAGELWIMDFFALPGFARMLVDHVRSSMFPGEECARSFRRRGGRRRAVRWRRSIERGGGRG